MCLWQAGVLSRKAGGQQPLAEPLGFTAHKYAGFEDCPPGTVFVFHICSQHVFVRTNSKVSVAYVNSLGTQAPPVSLYGYLQLTRLCALAFTFF